MLRFFEDIFNCTLNLCEGEDGKATTSLNPSCMSKEEIQDQLSRESQQAIKGDRKLENTLLYKKIHGIAVPKTLLDFREPGHPAISMVRGR